MRSSGEKVSSYNELISLVPVIFVNNPCEGVEIKRTIAHALGAVVDEVYLAACELEEGALVGVVLFFFRWGIELHAVFFF